MLSYEIMGWVALWILWGNTLLVALAALKQAGLLARRASELERRSGAPEAGADRLFRARIVRADGPSFAAYVVDQLGRYGAGAARRIIWHDRTYRSELSGGVLEVGARHFRVRETSNAEVWLGADEVDAASACPSRGAFEEAYPCAKKTRGAERTLSVPLGQGREVFVLGRVESDGDDARIVPPSDGPLFVAAMDPITWLRRRAAFARLGFVPAIVAGAAACTALALTPPVFDGAVSKLGGLLGLVFFLIVLPAGTSLRDFLREPSRRIVRGVWAGEAQVRRLDRLDASAASAAANRSEGALAGVPAPRTVQAPPEG
jgi:hypothetical protein